MNCKDEEDNGKGQSYLFCEASNVLFGNYKTKATYIHISEDVVTLLGIGIRRLRYVKLNTRLDHVKTESRQ